MTDDTSTNPGTPSRPHSEDSRQSATPLFSSGDLPDLREDDALGTGARGGTGQNRSREEFTTVYDILDGLQETLDNAKGAIFSPGYVRVDHDEVAEQLLKLKGLLPVQLERASALMRESERRLDNAQNQANSIITTAQNQARQIVAEAQEQAEFLTSQQNVTDMARERAREMIAAAQAKSDHLVHGADEYCTTVMTELRTQAERIGNDVDAGLRVLQERQQSAAQKVPHAGDDFSED